MSEMSVFLIPIIAMLGSFCMVIAIVSLISGTRRRRAQLRADVQMKLIDKFGSANDFVKFVESPEGRQFLQDAPRQYARYSVIGGVRAGIIISFLGLAFLLMGFTERDSGFFIPAFILIALGAGFFVSSSVATKMLKQSGEASSNSSMHL